MEAFLTTYDTIVVIGVVALQVVIVVVTLALALRRYVPKELDTIIAKSAMPVSGLIALFSMLGSLGYSDIFLFQPCRLCWYQRIFMYPQVLLLGLGAVVKEHTIRKYAMIMTGAGALVALYHYLMQFSIIPEGACSAIGYSVSCAEYFTAHLDYITIPMMALTAFLAIFVLLAYAHSASGDTR